MEAFRPGFHGAAPAYGCRLCRFTPPPALFPCRLPVRRRFVFPRPNRLLLFSSDLDILVLETIAASFWDAAPGLPASADCDVSFFIRAFLKNAAAGCGVFFVRSGLSRTAGFFSPALFMPYDFRRMHSLGLTGPCCGARMRPAELLNATRPGVAAGRFLSAQKTARARCRQAGSRSAADPARRPRRRCSPPSAQPPVALTKRRALFFIPPGFLRREGPILTLMRPCAGPSGRQLALSSPE